jgi:hypothetical protein
VKRNVADTTLDCNASRASVPPISSCNGEYEVWTQSW